MVFYKNEQLFRMGKPNGSIALPAVFMNIIYENLILGEIVVSVS